MMGNPFARQKEQQQHILDFPVPKFRFARQLMLLCFNIIGIYGVGLTLFLLIRELTGETLFIVALLNSFAHLFLMLAVLLGIICVIGRRFLSVLTLLPAIAVFFMTYGAFFLPHSAANSSGPDLHLLTFNVYSKRANPPQLANVIMEAEADVVLLQELDSVVAGHFDSIFQREYPYRVFHTPAQSSNAGMGVMSRYPILTEEYWTIHRGHQRITIEFQGSTVTLYNSRPIFPFEGDSFFQHEEEITALLERADQDRGPVILAGDFNMSDQSDDYAQITEVYDDAFREVGWGMGFTFPADNPDIDSLPYQLRELMKIPLVRLDYVFHSEHFQSTRAEVLSSSGGSDHRPLFVVLTLETKPFMHKIEKISKIHAFSIRESDTSILQKATGVFRFVEQE